MTNLEALRERLHAQATELQIGETTWRIGKLSAAEYRDLLATASGPDADAEQSGTGFRFYAALLSKTLLNGSGRLCDSDEGRAELPRLLTWEELKTLGQAAMAFNGMGDDAKKN